MKVILSRKGFDSANGGCPSPILPNGRMVSLPIPVCSQTCYSGLQLDSKTACDLCLDSKTTYYDLMQMLGMKKWSKEDTKCHLDPDIREDVKSRKPGWKACFGQCDKAQTHLHNQKVTKGDLFLFFGWFRHTRKCNDGWIFEDKGFHAIFGYMQIEEKIDINDKSKEPPDCMKEHPHLEENFNHSNNFIYVARDHLSWDQNLPGAGVFNFNEELVLTKHGLSRSKWCLPDFFKEDKIKISYHNESSYKDGYFQSAMIGQEFVIQDNEKVENCAKNLIKKKIVLYM